MAERKRRGEDAVDDRLDEVIDDDDAVDEDLADDDLDSDLDHDLDEDDAPASRRGSRSTLTKSANLKKTTKTDKLDKADAKRPEGKRGKGSPAGRGGKRPTKQKPAETPNILARFANFVREVVAELRKVIWPTRKELVAYTAVVVIFVLVMVAIVAGLDWVFAKLVVTVFGNGDSAES